MSVLSDESNPQYERYVRELFDISQSKFPSETDAIVKYILRHVRQHNIVIMNSNADRDLALYRGATEASTLFTVAIGGNLVSRGVTFDNLLSMFFTRDSKHTMQQDTYVQRARMFGSRGEYLECFELHIPQTLYSDWQRCFVLHKLSLSRITEGLGAPIWIGDGRIKPAAAASINRAVVEWQSGEMYWDIFKMPASLSQLIGGGATGMPLVRSVASLVGGNALPDYLLDFVNEFLVDGDESIVFHPVQTLTSSYTSADITSITRPKGLMGRNQLEKQKYPNAAHHFKIFANERGYARVYYKYEPPQRWFSTNIGRLTMQTRVSRP